MLELRVRHYLVAGIVLVGAGLAGAGLFVTSGLYNVSAARDHIDLTTWILDLVRRRSVSTHALGVEVPRLDGPGMVSLGARYYEFGCAPCHGAPGRPPSPVRAAMLPSPPGLSQAARDWSDAELFWIVRNGQKYTGMPSWIAPEREDEVWPVVAFLKRLPRLDEAAYAELASRQPRDEESSRFLDHPVAGLGLCASCHGPPDGLPIDDRVPWLGGQHPAYLARALHDYASGRRESGMMQLFAANLTDDEIATLASAYAAGNPPAIAGSSDSGNVAAGAAIYEQGIQGQGVPACISCHAEPKAARYPRIAGQSSAYIRQQLANWRNGLRRSGAYAPIMAKVAERLTPEQAADVAAYVATLPPPTGQDAP
jgi:cytochrome c553